MVRSTKPQGALRVLDRQVHPAPSTSGEAKSQIEVDLGLDVSTSVIGVCVLDHRTGTLIKIFPIKLTGVKFEDMWDKALEFEAQITRNWDVNWVIKRVFVEDVAKMFSPGFSSAGTIITLAKMNAIVCLTMFKLLGIKPTFVNVRSARASLGIKIDTKDKTKSTKEKVFEKVLTLCPKFPWQQHIAKTGKNVGQLVYDTCNQDMGDAWVTCRGGQILVP